MSRWDISRAGGLMRHQDGHVVLPLTLTAAEAEVLHAQLTRLLAPPQRIPRAPELGDWAPR